MTENEKQLWTETFNSLLMSNQNAQAGWEPKSRVCDAADAADGAVGRYRKAKKKWADPE